ncbi:hypothetical protein [Sphaerotilus sp.]|uniref:hypothetical protein n=1 Tax=Sphaerotilus sp. TaxID=2093942 RepID=UPI00286E6D31|nr:hypothetical protein [Sphaerotilus sp.]
MPIAMKPKTSCPAFTPAQIAASLEAATPAVEAARRVDWSKAVVTPGGGVAETISQLRRARETPLPSAKSAKTGD